MFGHDFKSSKNRNPSLFLQIVLSFLHSNWPLLDATCGPYVGGFRVLEGGVRRAVAPPGLHLEDLYAESGQTSQGSFSAVSKPNFASKYSLELGSV